MDNENDSVNQEGSGMMFPYISLENDTEIVFSELKSDGSVRVYVETPDEDGGFRNATCILPGKEWREINGYSEKEIDYYRKLIMKNADKIINFARKESNCNEVLSNGIDMKQSQGDGTASCK